MQKAEPQQNYAQNQPAQRQGGNAAFASPQGERIAQLEAMVESSPQASKFAQLAAMANKCQQVSQLRSFLTMDDPARQEGRSARHVVQRQINGVVETLPQNILALANTYNQLDIEATASVKIDFLSQVEHAVYAWLTANKAPDMEAVPHSAEVRRLMDSTKAERQRVVAHSVNVSHDHLGEGGIPIAGFTLLPHEEQSEVRGLWRGLIEGTGNIRIRDTESDTHERHQGFETQVLVEFSRLLEGRFGRSMIKDINTSTHQIVIEPFHAENDQHKSFAAGPNGGADEAQNLTKLGAPPDEGLRVHYPETVITGMNEVARLTLFNQLKPTQDGQLGVRLVDGGETAYYKFGSGRPVRVTMPSDLPDGSQYKESRLADAGGNELATPVFITLGHELGHGIHMQRGTLSKETNIPGFFGDMADRSAYLGDREEYVNIEGNENALRAEHGLGKRKGHYNIPYLQKQQMELKINQWLTWVDGLGALREFSVYREIDRLLTDMGNRTFTEWADPDKLAVLKRDFSILPGRIAEMQLKYLHSDFGKHMDAENGQMMRDLYGLKFSFKPTMDIVYIVDAIDREMRYEKIQSEDAVKRNTLPRYLADIPAQRESYARVKFDPKVALIENGIKPQVPEDQEIFQRLKEILRRFEAVNWLFPG